MPLLLQTQFIAYPFRPTIRFLIDGTSGIVVNFNEPDGVSVRQVLDFQHDMARLAEILPGTSDIIEDIPPNETVTLIATVC